MKAKVHAANLDEQFFIDSAGIGNWHAGQLPDSRMRERGASVAHAVATASTAEHDRYDRRISTTSTCCS